MQTLHFKILSTQTLKTLFQKYKLELTISIHTCIDHAFVNIGSLRSHNSWQPLCTKSEFTFFQSLSWLFQLAYFVKCKPTLLELNFYQPYPVIKRNKILSLLVFVLHKTWNQAFSCGSCAGTAKKCTKKCDAFAKLLFCLVKLLLFLLSRRCRILNFLLFTIDTLWSVRNRIFSLQIELLLLITSETFFNSSVVPSFLVRKAWWTNRATVAR